MNINRAIGIGTALFLLYAEQSSATVIPATKTVTVRQIDQAQNALMQDLASRLDQEPGYDVKNADNFSYVFSGCDYYGIYAVASGAIPLKHIAVYTGRNSDQIALEDSCFAALPADVQAGFQRVYVINAPMSATNVNDSIYSLILISLGSNQAKIVIDYTTQTPVQQQSWGSIKGLFQESK